MGQLKFLSKENSLTLANFKYNLKLVGLMLILAGYTGLVFFAGNNFSKLKEENKQSNSQTALKSPIDTDENKENTLSSSVLSSYVKLCTNTTYSFELSYPKDWFTTYNNPEEQCLHFAPFSFILPPVPDEDITPVTIRVIKNEDWETAVSESELPSEIWSISSSENIQVDGRAVEKIKYISTGENKPKGFIKVSYLIYNSKSPLILTFTQSEEKENIAKNLGIVEESVKSLKFY